MRRLCPILTRFQSEFREFHLTLSSSLMHSTLTGLISLVATGAVIALIVPALLWLLSGGLAQLFSAKMLFPLAIGLAIWLGNRDVS